MLTLRYNHLEDLMDDTIKEPHARLADLQQRMIGNCDEIIELLQDEPSKWDNRLIAMLSVLRSMLIDDQEITESKQSSTVIPSDHRSVGDLSKYVNKSS